MKKGDQLTIDTKYHVNGLTTDEQFHQKLRQNGINEIVKKGYYKNGTERA